MLFKICLKLKLPGFEDYKSQPRGMNDSLVGIYLAGKSLQKQNLSVCKSAGASRPRFTSGFGPGEGQVDGRDVPVPRESYLGHGET